MLTEAKLSGFVKRALYSSNLLKPIKTIVAIVSENKYKKTIYKNRTGYKPNPVSI
jgi:hypothetical protein